MCSIQRSPGLVEVFFGLTQIPILVHVQESNFCTGTGWQVCVRYNIFSTVDTTTPIHCIIHIYFTDPWYITDTQDVSHSLQRWPQKSLTRLHIKVYWSWVSCLPLNGGQQTLKSLVRVIHTAITHPQQQLPQAPVIHVIGVILCNNMRVSQSFGLVLESLLSSTALWEDHKKIIGPVSLNYQS